MTYIKVVIGFVMLLVAAEFMVRSAVDLAQRMEIPPLVIGMTIIALGTSAPEFVIGVEAALSGAEGLALGNVIGSNIANILLVLGAAALISPIYLKETSLARDALVLIGGSVLFSFMCMQGSIGLLSGSILVLALFGFLLLSYRGKYDAGTQDAEAHIKEIEDIGHISGNLYFILTVLVAGIAGVLYGANLLIDGGTDIARNFGVSEEVIGLTIIALGTSLPELTASIVAAFRGHAEVAIGNVVGSNLFNILGIAGVVSIISPLHVSSQIISFDVWVMLISTMMMLPILVWSWRLNRAGASLFLLCYLVYIGLQILGVEKVLLVV